MVSQHITEGFAEPPFIFNAVTCLGLFSEIHIGVKAAVHARRKGDRISSSKERKRGEKSKGIKIRIIRRDSMQHKKIIVKFSDLEQRVQDWAGYKSRGVYQTGRKPYFRPIEDSLSHV